MLVVNPWDWLSADGEIPANNPRLRRQVLAVLRIVEYGSRIAPGEHCETLIECRKRPGRRACGGLLWVQRGWDDSLLASCPKCQTEQMLVHNWRGTKWTTL